MIDILHELQEQLAPVLRSGDLARCERTVAERLAALPSSPFHIALDLAITNSPADVAAHCDGFFRQAAARARIGAAYAEMSSLDASPDRWFCELFAFSKYGGHDDYDWLADRLPARGAPLTITGLEKLQQVYASGAFQEKRFRDASYVVGLLVVTKFQDLIRRAAMHMQELHFPLLATVQDYDFIFEVRRDAAPPQFSHPS